MRRLAFSIAVLLCVTAVPAFAAETPPARVGRVSYVNGHVAFHTTGETQWSAAAVNYPVAAGSSFWTDPKSRAEIRIGPQTIDLNGDTEIDLTQLDQQAIKLAVPQGRIDLHLRQLVEGNTVEIDIPRGRVSLLQPGLYDIDAGDASHPARIAAFSGDARFVGGAADITIKSGDAAVISGTETLTATLEHAARDEFVTWCRARDYHESRVASAYYVSPQMTGYETLDEYGSWRSVPQYGQVWYPTALPADWVPYRDGSWIWEAPWGWTWVAAEPWGFAPFHYGRWAYIGGDWGWVPGGFAPWPVYAPALVAFVDQPAALLAAAIAGPAVGWFPLGPGEPYWPSYTRDPSYIRAINTGVVADPARLGARPAATRLSFANRAAATVVPRPAFAGAAPIAGAALPVAASAARQARVAARAPAIRPAAAGLGAARAAGGAAVAAGAPRIRNARSGFAERSVRASAARGRSRVAGPNHAHAAPHFAGRTAPHFARHAAPHFAGHAAPHFAAPHGGGPHFGGGGPPGGGPHVGAGGGGGPHGGGGGHGAGGGHDGGKEHG